MDKQNNINATNAMDNYGASAGKMATHFQEGNCKCPNSTESEEKMNKNTGAYFLFNSIFPLKRLLPPPCSCRIRLSLTNLLLPLKL